MQFEGNLFLKMHPLPPQNKGRHSVSTARTKKKEKLSMLLKVAHLPNKLHAYLMQCLHVQTDTPTLSHASKVEGSFRVNTSKVLTKSSSDYVTG